MAKRILVVDDSATMRSLVEQTLSTVGYEVLTSNDGQQGFAAWNAAKGSIDLVIADINMPVMDGLALVAEIRKTDEDVPILVLTSELNEEIRNRGVAVGANGWIVKPFHEAQFLDIIRQILA